MIVANDLRWMIDRARPPRVRTLREFAAEELVIPEGKFKGRRFNEERQPFARLFFDAIEEAERFGWNRAFVTGPTQSGKTLLAFALPIMYALFELGESVICGLPDMNMSGAKWKLDLLPAIRANPRLRELLPTSGSASRGAQKVHLVQFRNGAALHFLSGGGGDKSVAGYTAKIVVITETDGMDETGARSRETDRVKQLEARRRAFDTAGRTWAECTVSIDSGRTWREITAGSFTRIALPCPECGRWVTPERQHLTGHQDAETITEARRRAAWACPACGSLWTNEQRVAANRDAALVHRGQDGRTKVELDDDSELTHPVLEDDGGKPKLVGDVVDTDTLGFRWSAVNNMFVDPASTGVEEWKAGRAEGAAEEDSARRELRQFTYAIPYVPDATDLSVVDRSHLTRRVRPGLPRGVAPDDTEAVVMGVDLGKHLAHWVAVAVDAAFGMHVAAYGVGEVPGQSLGAEAGVMAYLRQLEDEAMAGAVRVGPESRRADLVMVDAGWMTHIVYRFVAEANARWNPDGAPIDDPFMAMMGFGSGQFSGGSYRPPDRRTSAVRFVGEHYHFVSMEDEPRYRVHADADHWKSFIRDRATQPMSADGGSSALTLHEANPVEHLTFAKHLTAERPVEEFEPGKGTVVRWRREAKDNHFGDALYMAAVAAHIRGARLPDFADPEPDETPTRGEPVARDAPTPAFTRDGMPYLVTERR